MYVNQEDIQPITAKAYLMKNWYRYNLTDTNEEFLDLLNILQACGESIETLHETVFNGGDEFCDIVHSGPWESDRQVVDALFEYCAFYKDKDFIDMILDRRNDYNTSKEWADDIIDEARDDIDGNNDVQITRTEDGYVVRIWC